MHGIKDTLIRHSQILSLRHPEKRVLDMCRYMALHNFNDGSIFPKVDGEVASFLKRRITSSLLRHQLSRTYCLDISKHGGSL